MIIINGIIHTMDRNKIIPNGFVRIEGAKIKDVGEMKDLADVGEEVIDAKGGYVLPGLVDAHTHLGMWEDSLAFEGDDGNEDTDPTTPHLRALDAVNPRDRAFEEALCAGITTVMTGPGSANPIGGQNIVMKTFGNCIDDMVIKAPAAMKFALGENPKLVYHGKNLAPVTRMATASLIRENLLKTKNYIEQKQKAQEEEESIDFDFKCESLIPLLEKKMPAHFHAHRADDIFTAIRIAKEFDLNYAIIHCTEGHLIASELGREKIMAIAGPALTDRSKPELKEQSFCTPGILEQNGCQVSITTDHPAIPIQYLPICAALAAKCGMGKKKAMQAITMRAAQICGVADRIGSIIPGKDADLVIFDGDPLDLWSNAVYVLVEGKVAAKEGKKI